MRNAAKFGAQARQKGTSFLKPQRASVLTSEHRKEPTGPRSMHERDEKLMPSDFRHVWQLLELAIRRTLYRWRPSATGCGLLRVAGLDRVEIFCPPPNSNWTPASIRRMLGIAYRTQ